MSTNFKSIKAERTTETRDIHNLETSGTGNIFETIVALSKRSNQVALSLKKELADKLEEFVIPTDSLEEVFENREQIEISKFYERLPKPHSIAIKELQDESLHIANEDEADDQAPRSSTPKQGRPWNWPLLLSPFLEDASSWASPGALPRTKAPRWRVN